MSTTFRAFQAADAAAIAVQGSQMDALGIHTPVRDLAHGAELAAAGPAWTAIESETGRILTCAGIGLIFPGHGVLWALLTQGIGPAHLAITRFARERIAQAGFQRIEAIARAEVAAECRWARLVGLTAVHVMEKWGPLARPHVLFERVS